MLVCHWRNGQLNKFTGDIILLLINYELLYHIRGLDVLERERKVDGFDPP